jgi:hypothetical protein
MPGRCGRPDLRSEPRFARSALAGERSGSAQTGSLSVRQPQHLMLARPCDGRIKQAGDADSVWQTTLDGSFDSRATRSSVVTPASISESQCRPRAIALTILSPVSERIGAHKPRIRLRERQFRLSFSSIRPTLRYIKFPIRIRIRLMPLRI